MKVYPKVLFSLSGIHLNAGKLWQRRVARWHTYFRTKIPIWVNFGGPCKGRCWYISWPFGLIYCHLGYFKVIWYIFCRFGMLYREKSGIPCEHSGFSKLWYLPRLVERWTPCARDWKEK
jgi:hypothetical protein